MWTEIEAEFTDPKGNKLFVTVGGNVEGNQVYDMSFMAGDIDLTDLLKDSECDYMSDLVQEAINQKADAMAEAGR